MTSLFPGRGDHWLAAMVLAAFALSGWKIHNRPAPGNFAVAPKIAAVPGPGESPGTVANFVSAVPGQAVHAASLVELRDRSLRAVWFSGSREGAGDVTIQTAVLGPGGSQWQPESTVFDRSTLSHGLMRYVKKLGNPVIARAPDGSLLLWVVNVSLGGWAGSAITWSRSVDEGANWSNPQRLVTSPFLNISTLVKGAPVALDGGGILLPVYHEFASKFAEILRLDERGRVVDKLRIPGSQASLQPVMLVEDVARADTYMRSAGVARVMTSRTADAGKTWSTASATDLPNPDSAVAGLAGKSGEKWLVLNPSSAGRDVLSMLAARNGESFEAAAVIPLEPPSLQKGSLTKSAYEAALGTELRASGASDAQVKSYVDSASRQLCNGEQCAQEFSYPFLLQSRDGYLHLVYTWNRTRIKHVKLDPQQLVRARTKGGPSGASVTP